MGRGKSQGIGLLYGEEAVSGPRRNRPRTDDLLKRLKGEPASWGLWGQAVRVHVEDPTGRLGEALVDAAEVLVPKALDRSWNSYPWTETSAAPFNHPCEFSDHRRLLIGELLNEARRDGDLGRRLLADPRSEILRLLAEDWQQRIRTAGHEPAAIAERQFGQTLLSQTCDPTLAGARLEAIYDETYDTYGELGSVAEGMANSYLQPFERSGQGFRGLAGDLSRLNLAIAARPDQGKEIVLEVGPDDQIGGPHLLTHRMDRRGRKTRCRIGAGEDSLRVGIPSLVRGALKCPDCFGEEIKAADLAAECDRAAQLARRRSPDFQDLPEHAREMMGDHLSVLLTKEFQAGRSGQEILESGLEKIAREASEYGRESAIDVASHISQHTTLLTCLPIPLERLPDNVIGPPQKMEECVKEALGKTRGVYDLRAELCRLIPTKDWTTKN